MMIMMIALVVTAIRKSRGLILLMRHGLLSPMGEEDGHWPIEMMDDGFISVKMRLDKKVIPSHLVKNESVGLQRDSDKVCENEKNFQWVNRLGIFGQSRQKY